jgi:transcriptional regulator with XRE-family HTH domain
MASPKLQNYLLSNRKRLALSQDDIAFLLGVESGTTMCRYERFSRQPWLETALAFEAIFQKPVRELFAGLYQKIHKEVAGRAKTLAARPERGKANRRTARKREAIAGIVAAESEVSSNLS